MPGSIEMDVQLLRDNIKEFPEPQINPALVVVSGLPGTGKSYFCKRLAERSPFCILESDALRKELVTSPNYGTEESTRLFSACHCLIENLLEKGVPVIFDATNLSEYNREQVYRIGEKTGAKLVIVRIDAPKELVYQRLQNRKLGMDRDNRSDADWNVYNRMKPDMDAIKRNHFVVDTSRDIEPVIKKILRTINK